MFWSFHYTINSSNRGWNFTIQLIHSTEKGLFDVNTLPTMVTKENQTVQYCFKDYRNMWPYHSQSLS